MYCKGLNRQEVLKDTKSLIDDALYNRLKYSYYITFRFIEETESILYEAYEKNGHDYISCEISIDGLFHGKSSKEATLYMYIFDKDNSLTDGEIATIYKPIISRLKPINKMNKDEKAKRFDDRKKFVNFIRNIDTSLDYTNDYKDIRVECLLDINEANEAHISLKIGKEKMYVIKSIGLFLSLFPDREYYNYGANLAFYHDIDCFDIKSQRLIRLLSRLYFYDNKSSSDDRVMKIYAQGLYELFDIYRDSYLEINGCNMYVEKEVSMIKVSISDDGKIDIGMPTKGNVFIAGTKGFVIEDDKIVRLINFENKVSGQIFEFLNNNPEVDYNNIKDLLSDIFIPLINGNVEISSKYKASHHYNELNINLYIDVNSNDEIVIKTEYVIGGALYNKYELMQRIIYRQQIIKFENMLKSFKFNENDIISSQDDVYRFITTDLSPLNSFCNVFLSESLKRKKVVKMPKIRINANYDLDWLNIEVESNQFSKKELMEILAQYNLKKKFYRYNDDFIILDDSLLMLNDLYKNLNLDNDLKAERVPFYEAFKLLSYDDSFDISYNQHLIDVFNCINNYSNYKIKIRANVEKNMRPYQIEGVKWLRSLYDNHLGGILADDMGLGKTLQIIAFISTLSINKPILIVSPKSLLFNWCNEFKKWDTSTKVKIIDGTKEQRINEISSIKNNKTVYLTSYDSLRNDLDLYKNIVFGLCVLDEAQYIKNVYAIKTKAVKKIQAKARFALTGTPIENSLIDLWSIFDFLMPNYLLSYDRFKQEYENLIVTDQIESATKHLIDKIRLFILRRTKAEVLKELPPKTEKIYTVEMKKQQREFYDAYLENAKLLLKSNDANKINQLAILTRLRQICVDPSMFVDNMTEISEKLIQCISIVEQALQANHKVLIFSSFTKSLDHLVNLLAKNKIKSLYINGNVTAKDRLDMANIFNNTNKAKVMLVSLKAGGTGLNLVGADIVIHLDPWWNLSAERQATDRAYRIGQTNPLTVIKLICSDTIEDKVLKLQELKNELVTTIIDYKKEKISSLSQEDIEYLLS